MNFILTESTQESELCKKLLLDETTFFIVSNVINFEFSDKTFDSYTCQLAAPSETDASTQFYLNIELVYHEAFAHYFYESVIYILFFKQLKELYPNMKLLMRKPKQFKHHFCELFGIQPDEIAYSIETAKNKVLFPSPESCLNKKEASSNWKTLVGNLFTFFSNIYAPQYSPCKVLILPRQVKENFWGNPRDLPLQHILSYAYDKNAEVLHTDTIKSFYEQIGIIRSAKRIIITDGSPLLVNGLFGEKKEFYIVDEMTIYQSTNYLKYAFILECIQKLNENTLHYYKDESACLSFLQSNPSFWSKD
jgi:hypothetical protein